ncbi:MAG: serine/threonine protein kinase [Ruminococcaceae bacterium]|nr:serine/threonine protein kinase [Oscillospiraceae bacterium]
MENSVKYHFFMSQITHIQDVIETEKVKISIVFYELTQSSCILRVCKNRDLSRVCEALIKTKNPNTVVIYDYVYENGDTYILEENLTGKTVEETLEQNGPFDERETAKIIIDICNSLEKLHNETPPVIHNDIKPSNIMIRDDMSVKLFDFDVSRIYKKGNSKNTTLFGTEEYASPEHFGYGQSEPRTDIYCLGVTMHKMLTGHSLTAEHRITYNGPLKKIILKCLEFDPKDRYTSVSSLRKDLERTTAGSMRTVALLAGILFICFLIYFFGWSIKDGNKTLNFDTEKKAISEGIVSKTGSKTKNKMSDSEESAIYNKDSVSENNEPTDNHSKEKSLQIYAGKEYSQNLEKNGLENWYKIKTGKENAVYRFALFPLGLTEDSYEYPVYALTLYNAEGIKVGEFDTGCNDDLGFMDVYLEPGMQYVFKIYGKGGMSESIGNYSLEISERVCDGGIDRESAIELSLGNSQHSKADSTLSDWYVINVENTGDFVVELHNIDVGCTLGISGYKNQTSVFSGWAKNEDSTSKTFSAKTGDRIYVEIDAQKDNANGNYILTVQQK